MATQSVAIETISHEEFDLMLKNGGAGHISPKFLHIYKAVRRLVYADEVIKVPLNGVKPQLASKKAHVAASPYGIDVHCKTGDGFLYIRRRRY